MIRVSNSTIAGNHGSATIRSGALGPGDLSLQSTIVSRSDVGTNGYDLYVDNNFSIVGTNTILGSSNMTIPTGNLSPVLGPLQWNGELTQTHALLPSSPAIGQGINPTGAATGQRGPGYPRTTGSVGGVDIGAYQFDSIFADAYERN